MKPVHPFARRPIALLEESSFAPGPPHLVSGRCCGAHSHNNLGAHLEPADCMMTLFAGSLWERELLEDEIAELQAEFVSGGIADHRRELDSPHRGTNHIRT